MGAYGIGQGWGIARRCHYLYHAYQEDGGFRLALIKGVLSGRKDCRHHQGDLWALLGRIPSDGHILGRSSKLLSAVFLVKQGLIALAPLNHGVQDGEQGASEFCDGVFRAWGEFRVDGFLHQSVVQQFLQLDVQYARGSFGQCLVQLGGAHGGMA